jgi:hypothetical protein
MSSDIISASEIQNGLLEEVRSFIAIDAAPLPQSFRPVVEALWTAAQKISTSIRLRKRINVVLAKSPFVLTLSTVGQLTFIPLGDAVHVTVEDMIFIDCEKMMRYEFPYQVVSVLEEFVHAFMNVTDEELVKQIVCMLYPDFEFSGGKYCLRQLRS